MTKIGTSRSVRRRGPDRRHPYYRPPKALRRWEQRLCLMLEHPEGAVRLWASLLNNAIRELVLAEPELRLAAYDWFLYDGTANLVGSFPFVVEQLDLDSAAQIRHDVFEDAHARHRAA